MSALVISKLDYGNATLYGLPDSQLNRYQAVQNAAARLIFGARGRDHVTPLLKQLHWLRVPERISFKIGCITWRCLNGSGPEYLSDDFHRASENCRRQGLRSEVSLDLIPLKTCNVNHGDRTWPAAAASVLNSLKPNSLKGETDYLAFRRGLKTYLWQHSYT